MFELWYLLPVGILIAIIATLGGTGAAILLTPFLILVTGIDPLTAIFAALIIELLGFSTGIFSYWRNKEIDFDVVHALVWWVVPGTIVGVLLSHLFSTIIIIMIILISAYLVYKFLIKKPTIEVISDSNIDFGLQATAGTGGFCMGLVSSGLGETAEYIFLDKLKMPTTIANGTSILLIVISAAGGVIAHSAFLYFTEQTEMFLEVIPILIFTIPGVIIGSHAGIRAVQVVSETTLRLFLGTLFAIVAGALIITF